MVSASPHNAMTDSTTSRPPYQSALGGLIFFSRWLQAPLYIGLIAVQAIYVYQFFHELVILVQNVFFPAVAAGGGDVVKAVGEAAGKFDEKDLMVAVLKLVDVVMIANLLVMVIVGGYETFVSRLNLKNQPGSARVALARERRRAEGEARHGAHRHFLDPTAHDVRRTGRCEGFCRYRCPKAGEQAAQQASQTLHWDVFWQVVVHLTFVVSALLLAITDRITVKTAAEAKHA